MTNQGVSFQPSPGGQFSAVVDTVEAWLFVNYQYTLDESFS
jgi:hypothetical protein